MSDYNLGTARGVIEIGYKGDGVDNAVDDLKRAEKQTGDTTASMRTLSTGALVAGGAVAAGLAVAVNSAASFEKRLSAVQAVSGATSAEMDLLSDKALQLGKDTQYSATESASAIEELVKAGLSVEDVLNGAADATVNLAAAGEVSLPEAATIASNAMNQFGLAAEDMPKVADAIAGAANASAIDVGEFGYSLSQVGAVAHLAGLSFEDTAVAIAEMGNAGIKGSDAGTSLKSMLSRLQPTTKKAANLMKSLGLIAEDGSNAFYDQNGKLKSLADIQETLKKSLTGMTAQQKQATLQTLFGADAIRAAAVLSEEGAAGFDKMAEGMGKVGAADVAKTRMDNLSGSVEKLKGGLETAAISIGDALVPAIRTVADGVSSLVNVFLGLPKGVATGIAIFATAAAAILLIVGAVMKVIIFVGQFQKALVVLRGTMAATWVTALGPIALVIAAIAAVVAIIVLLWKHSETFRGIVIGVWNAIKTAIAAVVSWFTSTLVPAVTTAWNAIVTVVRTVVSVIATVIRTYINIWWTIISTALNAILAVWRAVWGVFAPIVKAVFGLIMAVVKLAWTVIKGVFLTQLAVIKAVVSSAFRAISTVVRTVMNAIKAVISAVWRAIGPIVKGAVNTIKSVVSTAWNAVKAVTSTVWNGLKGVVSKAISAVVTLVKGIKGKVLGPLSGAAGWLYRAGREIIEGLVRGITAVIHKVTDAMGKVTGAIKRFLPGSPVEEGPLMVLNRGYAGKQIVHMIAEGIDDDGADIVRTLATNLVVPRSALEITASTLLSGPLTASSAGSVPSVGSGALRLVSGTLSIDKSGRAFISGVAQDVVNVNAADAGTASRQRRIA